jgi:hypothetical protein
MSVDDHEHMPSIDRSIEEGERARSVWCVWLSVEAVS